MPGSAVAAVRGSSVSATGDCGHAWSVAYLIARKAAESHGRLVCGVCGLTVHASVDFSGRTCETPGCANRLAARNPGPECFACQEATRLADVQALAA